MRIVGSYCTGGTKLRHAVRRWPGLDSAKRLQPSDLAAGHLQGPAKTVTTDTDHLLSLVARRVANDRDDPARDGYASDRADLARDQAPAEQAFQRPGAQSARPPGAGAAAHPGLGAAGDD